MKKLQPARSGSNPAMPEFIDPVFTKASQKRSFSVIQNERFGLVFAKTGSIISGTGNYMRNIWRPPLFTAQSTVVLSLLSFFSQCALMSRGEDENISSGVGI
jgi:hypothetical protein